MADVVELIYADHDWLRRQFFLLDHARTEDELSAVWGLLADRLLLHADAEESVFYPALLATGRSGDPVDETEDAIGDHNEIRDAISAARVQRIGSSEWFSAVGRTRTENGKHLDEEERGALADFIKSSDAAARHAIAMQWVSFYASHSGISGIDAQDKNPQDYVNRAASGQHGGDR